jgi:WD40 repeat protein
VAFSPDGSRLATGSADLTVRLWDVERGIAVAIFSDFSDPVYNLAFTSDGARMVANSSGTEIVVYDTVPFRERADNIND